MPSTLPNVTRQDFLTLWWALRREGGTARAVGLAEPSSGATWDAVLDLYGLDSRGRIVSRGSSPVRPSFVSGPTPLEVRLVETGQEAEFRLVVARSRQSSRPGDWRHHFHVACQWAWRAEQPAGLTLLAANSSQESGGTRMPVAVEHCRVRVRDYPPVTNTPEKDD